MDKPKVTIRIVFIGVIIATVLIIAYAPQAGRDEEEKDKFYKLLTKLYNKYKKHI